MNWYWEIITGVAGALAYWLLRYDRREGFLRVYFTEEWPQLLKGIIGFGVLYVAWEALALWPQMPFTPPPMSKAVAVVVGFAAKKVIDYTVGRLARAA